MAAISIEYRIISPGITIKPTKLFLNMFFGFLSMRIGIISDLHLGYARFEGDSYEQAGRMLAEMEEKVDIAIIPGDIFDSRIPKLETIRAAVEIFKNRKIPIVAIHGNHERRSRGFDNPLNILASADAVEYLDGRQKIFERNGEKIAILCVGSVPEEQAEQALKEAMEKNRPVDGAFNILVIHQNITEIVNQTGLALGFLESLPFDLIINGHIHKRYEKLNGKLIVPGSTVITQLKKEEMEPKGYVIYDTKTRKAEFFEVPTRKFFYEELVFDKAGEAEIVEKTEQKIKELRSANPDAIIAVKIAGTLREGLKASDIRIRNADPMVFLSNELNVAAAMEKISEIKKLKETGISAREFGRLQLERILEGKLRLIKTSEFFEKLIEDEGEAEAYINGIIDSIAARSGKRG